MSKQETLPLDAALQYCQAWGLVLCYSDSDATLWAPNTRGVSIRVRRSLRVHRATIAAMMRAADVRVCPAPGRHRKSWHKGTCSICKCIEPSMHAVHQDDRMLAGCAHR